MKISLKLILVSVLIVSCQDQKKDASSLKSLLESQQTIQKKEKVSKNPKSIKTLTKADFEHFFPKQIGDYNLIQVGEDKINGTGSGTYIKGKDYGKMMTYYVADGDRKGAAAIRNFEDSYQSNQTWSDGTERISKDRDGYRTFALLQHRFNKYKVSMLYNNRFVLTVEGHEKPDELWEYLKQADLQSLEGF